MSQSDEDLERTRRELLQFKKELDQQAETLRREQAGLAERRQADAFLRLVINHIPDYVFWKDRNSVYLGCNQVFAQAAGVISPEHIVGKTDYELSWKKEESDFYTATDRRVMGNDQAEYHIIEPQLQANGRQIWLETNKVPLHDEHGNVIGILGSFMDVTRRKEDEAALLDAKLRQEALFQNARDAIFIADPDTGIILEVNHQAEALLGRPREELLGLHQSFLHPAALRESLRQEFVRHAAGHPNPVETQVLHQDGRHIPVEISSSVVTLLDGSRLLMGMFRDISERLRLQEQFRQAEKLNAIGQLAGGVAHDFNNQLTGISGYAEMLLPKLTDPQQRKWVESILGAARRSADLTRQLLAFARKGLSQRVPTDLHVIITEVIELLRRSLDPRITITQRLTANPSLTLGDPGQLHHLLLNIAINARDAMAGQGEMTFTTAVVTVGANRFMEIVVSDTGCGMDAETLRHIFEPFFTTKKQGEGTGLGLAAAYGMVTNHGGTITATSTLGRGSSFTIRLPLFDAEPAAKTPTSVAIDIARSAQHILVLDDEAMVGELTAEMLRELGYLVTTCTQLDQALAVCQRPDPIDLVVLDMVMPRCSGREAFVAMRAVRPHLTVLLASGFSLNSEIQAVLDLGACGLLGKPFRMQELARAVSAALDH